MTTIRYTIGNIRLFTDYISDSRSLGDLSIISIFTSIGLVEVRFECQEEPKDNIVVMNYLDCPTIDDLVRKSKADAVAAMDKLHQLKSLAIKYLENPDQENHKFVVAMICLRALFN